MRITRRGRTIRVFLEERRGERKTRKKRASFKVPLSSDSLAKLFIIASHRRTDNPEPLSYVLDAREKRYRRTSLAVVIPERERKRERERERERERGRILFPRFFGGASLPATSSHRISIHRLDRALVYHAGRDTSAEQSAANNRGNLSGH